MPYGVQHVPFSQESRWDCLGINKGGDPLLSSLFQIDFGLYLEVICMSNLHVC